MRLIDTEAIENEAMKERTDILPTVDAIPIEWISKYLEEAGYVACYNSHSVEFMLRKWRCEHEERKEE